MTFIDKDPDTKNFNYTLDSSSAGLTALVDKLYDEATLNRKQIHEKGLKLILMNLIASKGSKVLISRDNNLKVIQRYNALGVGGTAVANTDTDTSNTGNVTLDFSANQNFVLTLTGNTTLVNPSTEQVGQSGFIAFIQDGTGSRTVSLGTDYETAGSAGLTLTSTASATDLVPYLVVASGRILLGTPQLAFG